MTNSHIHITEVGPRDGLQNESLFIPTKLKLEFIEKLSKSGLKTIEATSFVSPKWIPQMADHREILQSINLQSDIHYPVLIPNMQGLNNAMQLGVKDIAVFIAASETFSQKNTNCSISDSLSQTQKIMQTAIENDIRVRGYISCVMGCPYEGDIGPTIVSELAHKLILMGAYEASLGDTIGIGTPEQTYSLLEACCQHVNYNQIAVHFHDTKKQALENIKVSLEYGIRSIDCSAAGLGGCPYAPGAKGNVATEEVLACVHSLGYHTGVDQDSIAKASIGIIQYINNSTEKDT